jgi:hypothetical protein
MTEMYSIVYCLLHYDSEEFARVNPMLLLYSSLVFSLSSQALMSSIVLIRPLVLWFHSLVSPKVEDVYVPECANVTPRGSHVYPQDLKSPHRKPKDLQLNHA